MSFDFIRALLGVIAGLVADRGIVPAARAAWKKNITDGG
jgi:hypothetical protein